MSRFQLVFLLVGLLFLILGWPLATRRVPPNRLYGLRVRATFADSHVWYDANAVAGRDMMALGLTIVILVLLPLRIRLQEDVYAAVGGAFIGVGALLLTFRGWRTANRMLRTTKENSPNETLT
jgi:uncharacterized membrane protein